MRDDLAAGIRTDCRRTLVRVILDEGDVVRMLVHLMYFEEAGVLVTVMLHHIIVHLNGDSVIRHTNG